MCGIVTIAAVRGRSPSVDEATVARMRDTLAARGPDDAGFWSDGQVHMAHRRLAIMAPASNRQPLVIGDVGSPDRVILCFNGELYDQDALRRALAHAGRRVDARTDTELLAHAIAQWGHDAPRRIRGMFSFVAWCPGRNELLAARDALGVVPLFFAVLGDEILIASEPRAILAHPEMPVRPDWPAVANYLNSLRTTMAGRTMFQGVHALGPGELLRCALHAERPTIDISRWWTPPHEESGMDEADAVGLLRETLDHSIDAHLVSDVPLCSLLSGGLDSTIIAARATRSQPTLMTFCAGAVPESGDDGDLAVARRVAAALGTRHIEAPINQQYFLEHWPRMVAELGMPLSTPNEVAIYAVAQAIRPHAKVALSGEGADELFAGYGPALEQCNQWIHRADVHDGETVGAWHTSAFGWVPQQMLGTLLSAGVASQCDDGRAGIAALNDEYALAGDPMSLRTHVDVQRRLNLASLLQRLNTATMLASVEGRTPFADVRVAELAARIPLRHLYAAPERDDGGGTAVATLPRTKRVLRTAFADCIPVEALIRPKASFPLPFERWIGGATEVLTTSPAARAVFSEEARVFIGANANENWRLAWPTLNVALWLRRWFD